MNDKAFFFQSDNLLLPPDTEEKQICEGVSLDWTKNFENAEIFDIPCLENPCKTITVVSLPPQDPDAGKVSGKTIPIRQILAMFATCAIQGKDVNLTELIRACHIVQWRRESRFCGSCGTENYEISPHRVCPKCGREEYPRICPAILVLITDDKNRILLAHNKKFRKGVYSHISGFNEAGESLEETVVREVLEEVNINIKDIEYIKSQPWPFPNSLMIGFRAQYAFGTIQPDGEEIEDARWFTKEKLPELPAEGSLSRWMIEQWLNDL